MEDLTLALKNEWEIMCISNIIHELFDACPNDESYSPSARATRRQMRLATTFQEARIAAKAFQGKPLINQRAGMVVIMARKSLDKMFSRSAVAKSESPTRHAAAVANADYLFTHAVYGWSKSDRAGDPNIVAIHRFFALMGEVGECVRLAKLTVKEIAPFSQHNALYTLEVVAVNDRAAAVEYIQAAAREDGIDLGEERAPSGGSEQSR